jgi:hypothetical protein
MMLAPPRSRLIHNPFSEAMEAVEEAHLAMPVVGRETANTDCGQSSITASTLMLIQTKYSDAV